MTANNILPAGKAASISLRKGQFLKITNTFGKQVVDFWAFNPKDSHDFLSMVHTRTVLLSIALRRGSSIYSTRRRPMLTLVEDTTNGVHDMLWSACDLERYRMLGADGYHANCADNMHNMVKECFPDLNVEHDWVPDPLNLFMNVAVDHHGGLDVRAPTSQPGQFVVLRAEVDLDVVMTSCAQDMAPVNAGKPADCQYQVMDSFLGAECHQPPAELMTRPSATAVAASLKPVDIPRSLTARHSVGRVKVALSFDFDAVSHWLGTGCHKDNNMADYSSGVFAGQVGALRLLNMLKKNDIADKVTWFIPGHTIETFPDSVIKVFESGAEIGLHGYSHEGIYQMTPQQERDVLLRCIEVATKLCGGKKPRGYRAPMYTIRETTVELLRQHKFLYNSSLMHHDSQPYWTPSDPPVEPIDFSKEAASWLKPTPIADAKDMSPLRNNQHPLVEIPCGWYNEDMMPMMYLPHLANSMGYVSTRVVEQMWKDKFTWLWEQAHERSQQHDSERTNESLDFVFPILMHPDVTGMAHIMGMADRFIKWLKSWGTTVEFCKHEDIASAWLESQRAKEGSM